MSTYTETVRLQDHISQLEQRLARSTEHVRILRQQRAQAAGRLRALQQQGASPEVLQPLHEAYNTLVKQFVAAIDTQGQTEHELLVSQNNLQQLRQ